jgi:uncharacterized protein YcfL
MRKLLLLFIVLSILLGCNKDDKKNVSIFFNPAGSAKINQYDIVVTENKQVVFDTILKKDMNIDKSILLKSFYLNPKSSISISINNKVQLLKINNTPSKDKCVNVFLSYNDRIIIRSLYDSFTKKSIEETGVIPDYVAFLDSLTVHGTSTSQFDSLMINVKQGKCYCDSKYN